MGKERLMAIFIGSIMLMSVVGFGLSNANFRNTESEVDVPYVVN